MMIAEMFRSIQGEGRSQGYPCTFLRLAGCNLRCHWCDTAYAQGGGTEKGEAEIISEIECLKGKRICITGGGAGNIRDGGFCEKMLDDLRSRDYRKTREPHRSK